MFYCFPALNFLTFSRSFTLPFLHLSPAACLPACLSFSLIPSLPHALSPFLPCLLPSIHLYSLPPFRFFLNIWLVSSQLPLLNSVECEKHLFLYSPMNILHQFLCIFVKNKLCHVILTYVKNWGFLHVLQFYFVGKTSGSF